MVKLQLTDDEFEVLRYYITSDGKFRGRKYENKELSNAVDGLRCKITQITSAVVPPKIVRANAIWDAIRDASKP